jgi:hypothetical protein
MARPSKLTPYIAQLIGDNVALELHMPLLPNLQESHIKPLTIE